MKCCIRIDDDQNDVLCMLYVKTGWLACQGSIDGFQDSVCERIKAEDELKTSLVQNNPLFIFNHTITTTHHIITQIYHHPYMDYSKSIAHLETDCTNKLDFMRLTLLHLKKEGKRMLSLVTRYQNLKKTEVLQGKDTIASYNLAEIQQYGQLSSKQFYDTIKLLNDNLLKNKAEIVNLAKEIKAKPTQDYTTRVQKMKGSMGQFENEFGSIWREEHFLMLNYRMEICAREVQRWTSIMNGTKGKEESMKERIESLFL